MATPRIKVLNRRQIYSGYHGILRLIREKIVQDGVTMTRDFVEHPGAVVIVPMVDAKHIVFVHQYRRAVARYLLELPAGTRAWGEPHLPCAKRELEEETGYKAGKWTKLGAFYAAPGFLSEQLTLFKAERLTECEACPEEDEILKPVVLSIREAEAKMRTGAICDAKTIIGLQCITGRLRLR